MSDAVMEPQNQIDRIAVESGMADLAVRPLRDAFYPFFEQAMKIRTVADNINVTDATQVTEIKEAYANRRKLAEVRIAAEKVRKHLKEESLRKGELIQNFYKVIAGITEPAEARLLEMEQFAERAEAARRAALGTSRYTLLAPFVSDMTGYDLGAMPEATFTQLLDSSRTAHEARIAAAKKAEEERLAAEAARIEEEKRIRADNERVRLELADEQRKAAAEREASEKAAREAAAKAAAERKAIEDAARKEREAIQAKADAEARAAAEKAKAEREAAEAAARKDREAAEAKAAEAKRLSDAKIAAAAKAKRAAEAVASELLEFVKEAVPHLERHADTLHRRGLALIAKAEGGAA